MPHSPTETDDDRRRRTSVFGLNDEKQVPTAGAITTNLAVQDPAGGIPTAPTSPLSVLDQPTTTTTTAVAPAPTIPRPPTPPRAPVDPFAGIGEGVQAGVSDVIQRNISGASADPLKTALGEAQVRGAQQFRATTAAQGAPLIGQGAAVTAGQAAEQAIFADIADTQLEVQTQVQQSMDKGLDQAQSVAALQAGVERDQRKLDLDEAKFEDAQFQTNLQRLLDAKDFDGAAALFQSETGGTMDVSVLQDDLSFYQKNQDSQGLLNVIENGLGLLELGILSPEDAQGMGAMVATASSAFAQSQIGDTFTDEDWANIDAAFEPEFDEFSASLTPEDLERYKFLGTAIDQVAEYQEWTELETSNPELFNFENIGNVETLGEIAGALQAQSSGSLSTEQRDLLQTYPGLYDANRDLTLVQGEAGFDSAVLDIEDTIADGDIVKALSAWNAVPEEFRSDTTFSDEFYGGEFDDFFGEDGSVLDTVKLINEDGTMATKNENVLNAIANSNSDLVGDPTALSGRLTQWTTQGDNRWILNEAANTFLDNNTGKIVTVNGKNYIVTGGKNRPTSFESVASIDLYDPITGQVIQINGGGGKIPSSKSKKL